MSSRNTSSRSAADSTLESRTPRMLTSSGMRQAAATIGPAALPAPLSSMPVQTWRGWISELPCLRCPPASEAPGATVEPAAPPAPPPSMSAGAAGGGRRSGLRHRCSLCQPVRRAVPQATGGGSHAHSGKAVRCRCTGQGQLWHALLAHPAAGHKQRTGNSAVAELPELLLALPRRRKAGQLLLDCPLLPIQHRLHIGDVDDKAAYKHNHRFHCTCHMQCNYCTSAIDAELKIHECSVPCTLREWR